VTGGHNAPGALCPGFAQPTVVGRRKNVRDAITVDSIGIVLLVF